MAGVTIRDIAVRSGLSVPTVSKILNDKGSYPDSTRDRVQRVARELGYRPNRSARAMQSGRFGCVALLGSTIASRSVLPEQLLAGVMDVLAEHDLQLLLAALPDASLADDGYVPRILREWMVDGLLINYNADIPAALAQVIEGHQLPAVWINSKQEHDCVFPDDFEAAREAAERLINLGHRRIAYVDWVGVTHYSRADRARGYEEAMAARGLTPTLIAAEGTHSHLVLAERVLDRPAAERPTAVITYAPFMATTLAYAAARRGRRVPEDLSLVCFNNRVERTIGQALDAMVLPEAEMGRLAVEMLLQKIEDPSRRLAPRAVRATYGAGEMVAPPP
jgi:LacI family transcriptional regulator